MRGYRPVGKLLRLKTSYKSNINSGENENNAKASYNTGRMLLMNEKAPENITTIFKQETEKALRGRSFANRTMAVPNMIKLIQKNKSYFVEAHGMSHSGRYNSKTGKTVPDTFTLKPNTYVVFLTRPGMFANACLRNRSNYHLHTFFTKKDIALFVSGRKQFIKHAYENVTKRTYIPGGVPCPNLSLTFGPERELGVYRLPLKTKKRVTTMAKMSLAALVNREPGVYFIFTCRVSSAYGNLENRMNNYQTAGNTHKLHSEAFPKNSFGYRLTEHELKAHRLKNLKRTHNNSNNTHKVKRSRSNTSASKNKEAGNKHT